MNITKTAKPLMVNICVTSPGGTRIRTLSDEPTVFYQHGTLVLTITLEQAEEIVEMVHNLQRKQPA